MSPPSLFTMQWSPMTKPAIDRSRHLLKTVSWRAVGTLDTIALGWIVSGDPSVGMTIGSLELVTKMILYYIHERAWYRFYFGINNRGNNDTGS